MVRLIGKNKRTTKRIGYTTHNGLECILGTAENNQLARLAVAVGRAAGRTNKIQGKTAVLFLKDRKVNRFGDYLTHFFNR